MLDPELKQLRKDKRFLDKLVTKQQQQIKKLTERLKLGRISYGNLLKELNAFKDLSYREQQVLEMRFGLVDGVPHTLEEVGREFDVTRGRIRQVQELALDKIKYFIIK